MRPRGLRFFSSSSLKLYGVGYTKWDLVLSQEFGVGGINTVDTLFLFQADFPDCLLNFHSYAAIITI